MCDGVGGCVGMLVDCLVSIIVCVISYMVNGVDCTPNYVVIGLSCDDKDGVIKNDVCDVIGNCVGIAYVCVVGFCEVSSISNGVDCDVVLVVVGMVCDDANDEIKVDICDG